MSKNWLLQIPLILSFWVCFVISEGANRGGWEGNFLREKVLPWVSRPPQSLTDMKFKFRGSRPLQNKLAVVEIDSGSINALGRWPWHRDTVAYLVEKIFQAGAKVVGLDMVFSEADPRVPSGLADLLKQKNLGEWIAPFETDGHLEKVIQKYSDRLVLGWMSDTSCRPKIDGVQDCPVTDAAALAEFPQGFNRFALRGFQALTGAQSEQVAALSFVTPITNIQPYHVVAQQMGFLNASLDSDGTIRKSPLMAFAAGLPYASLPLEMARVGRREELHLELAPDQSIESLSWVNSKKKIPINRTGTMEINFRGPSSLVPRVAALDVMGDAGVSKTELLSDAYVIIGVTALGVHDMRQFPFESNSPGVDGHIQILDNLLTGDAMIPGGASGSGIWISVLMLALGAAFAWALNRWDALPGLWLFLVTFIGVGFLDFRVLFYQNYNLNSIYFYFEWVSILVVTLAAKYTTEERNKKFIREAFSKYVAPAVVDSILKDPHTLSLGGEKREMTILFSDIRNFTSFSEEMDAKALTSFLNDYLGIMTGIVFKHEGTLDKYIGDAVMAFWGAPVKQSKHAFQACQAAIEMMDALKLNQNRFKEQYGIDVRVGIGINSGLVNVGNMGSQQNFEYTVIGDQVNLASRVEGLTKQYGVRILTTRYTWDIMKNNLESNSSLMPEQSFNYRVLDDVKVKGKKQAVELIEILERPLSSEGVNFFQEGRRCYRVQHWDEAIQWFEKAQGLLSAEDGPCAVYLDRCRTFQKHPPASDWDGSWEMESK